MFTINMTVDPLLAGDAYIQPHLPHLLPSAPIPTRTAELSNTGGTRNDNRRSGKNLTLTTPMMHRPSEETLLMKENSVRTSTRARSEAATINSAV